MYAIASHYQEDTINDDRIMVISFDYARRETNIDNTSGETIYHYHLPRRHDGDTRTFDDDFTSSTRVYERRHWTPMAMYRQCIYLISLCILVLAT